MTVLRFTVPIAPVGVNRGSVPGSYAKSPEMRAYQEAVAACGLQARVKAGGPSVITGPVEVELWFFYPSDLPDSDGPVKPTIDALQVPNARLHRVGAGILDNDRQVTDGHWHKRIDSERPRVEVEVREMASAGPVARQDARARDLRALLPPKKRAGLLGRRLTSSVKRYAR